MTSAHVSVVVVNLNGCHHLEPFFQSLIEQDYPAEQIEIILVDNASQDGSLELVREHFPMVRVIQNTLNVGFAPAVNQGVAAATAPYVALLNNDTRMQANWITVMVKTIEAQRERGVVCVGSQILDWDGQRIDFISGGASFYGFGYQFLSGSPVEVTQAVEHEALFACGGAMLVERKIFLDVGGFDEDFFAYYEDVDFGWRLWVLGYRVIITPATQIYHRLHGTSRRMQPYQLHTLFERNALMMVIKNYEEANLHRVLSTALLFMFQRMLSYSEGKVAWQQFDFARSGVQPASDQTQSVPRLMLSPVVAIKDIIDEFPRLWHKREQIQRQRVCADASIFPLLQFPFGGQFQHSPHPAVNQTILEALGIATMLSGTRMHRVLILSSDPISSNLAGVGIRAVELARSLSSTCAVTLAAPDQAEISLPGVQSVAFPRDDELLIAKLVTHCEVVIVQGYQLRRYPIIHALRKILVVDLYDPFYFEQLELFAHMQSAQTLAAAQDSLETLNDQLRSGDFFICASERQRDFWIGMLTALGRLDPTGYRHDPTFRSLIDVVPFGCATLPPVHTQRVLKGVVPGIDEDDTLVLWGGGIWDWLDPLTVIRAMALVRAQRPQLKLFFLGYRHPNPTDVPNMAMHDRAVALAQELELYNKTVFFNDRWVPFAERANYLLEADIGVSAHLAHIETRFAFRTRLLDYIWAGLPMVLTEGDVLAEAIPQQALGLAVPVGDPASFAAALLSLSSAPNLRARYADSFAAVRDQYSWERALAPLVAFCRSPRYAPDRLHAEAEARALANGSLPNSQSGSAEQVNREEVLDNVVAEKNAHIAELERLIRRLESGRLMRLLRWFEQRRQKQP